jgi:hypothetical protein
METVREQLNRIEPKDVRTGGFVIISVGILVLIILQFIGMGFASRIAFSRGSSLPDGRICYNISRNDVNLTRMASVLLWIGFAFQADKIYKQVCNNRPISCIGRLIAMGSAVLFTAEFFGLIILTRFAFALEKVNGGYCAKLTNLEQSLLGTAMIIVWISVIVFGIDIVTLLLEFYKKRRSSRYEFGHKYGAPHGVGYGVGHVGYGSGGEF